MATLATDEWKDALLDSLPAASAVLDAEGVVVATNAAWNDLAQQGDRGLSACEIGVDCVGAWLALTGRIAEAPIVAAGLADVIAGRRTEFTAEYAIATEGGEHAYAFRAYPLARNARGAIVANVDLSRRIRAEQQAERSNTHLQAALESMSDAVFVSDAEGNFVELNTAFAIFHRFRDKAECLRHLSEYPHILDVFLPDGTRAALDQWVVPRALRGEVGRKVEYTLRLKATGETWIGEYNYAPIRDTHGRITGAVVVCRDVTAQRRAEGALRDSEQRLVVEAQSLQSLVIATDRLWSMRTLESGLREALASSLVQLGADMGHIYLFDAGDRALRVHVRSGYEPGVAHEPDVMPAEHPCACARAARRRTRIVVADIDDATTDERERAKAIAGGYRATQSTPLIHADGRVLGVLTTCWRTSYVPTLSDEWWLDLFSHSAAGFVERCRLERELEAGTEKLTAMLDSAMDGIVMLDSDGSLTSVNPAAERMFGYTAKELLGRSYESLLVAPLRPRGEHEPRHDLLDDLQRLSGRSRSVRARHRDGSTFPIALSIAEVDHNRTFVGVIHDLSDRDEMQARLLECVAAEQRRIGVELHDGVQQELTGLSLFAASIADLLERAQRGAEVPWQRLQKMLDRLQGGLRETHGHVRALARGILPAEIETKGLDTALQELVERVGRDSKVRCRLVRCNTAGIGGTTAKHLYRIAQEAINNALKHAEPRTITVSIDEHETGWTLDVEDNGRGIDQTTEAGQRYGVGTRTMEYRASLLGGTLSVGPRRPRGTRVRCEIPRPPN